MVRADGCAEAVDPLSIPLLKTGDKLLSVNALPDAKCRECGSQRLYEST